MMNVNVYTNVLILKLIKAFIKKYNNSNCIHNDLLLHPVFCGSKNVVLINGEEFSSCLTDLYIG